MKAKEIVKKLEEEKYSRDSLVWLAQHFHQELIDLKKSRNVKTDAGLVGIFRDQYKKWLAVSRKSDGRILKDGYWKCLELASNKDVVKFAKSKVL